MATYRTYRIWMAGHPARTVEAGGYSVEDAVLTAAVQLLTREERQRLAPDVAFAVQITGLVTVKAVDDWIDQEPTDMAWQEAQQAWKRNLLHGKH